MLQRGSAATAGTVKARLSVAVVARTIPSVQHHQPAAKNYSFPEMMSPKMAAGTGWCVEVVRGSWAHASSRARPLVILNLKHSAYLTVVPSFYQPFSRFEHVDHRTFVSSFL